MTHSRIALGTSNLSVFPLNLGGNVFGWTADRQASFDILDAFTAGGGNFVDTADGYSAWVPGNTGGESERLIGEWHQLRGNRDELVIATKVSEHPEFKGLSASNIAAAADASLRRLRTDHIDLYYAHFDDASVPLEETVAALSALVDAGKVRYIGISNYSAARIAEGTGSLTQRGCTARWPCSRITTSSSGTTRAIFAASPCRNGSLSCRTTPSHRAS